MRARRASLSVIKIPVFSLFSDAFLEVVPYCRKSEWKWVSDVPNYKNTVPIFQGNVFFPLQLWNRIISVSGLFGINVRTGYSIQEATAKCHSSRSDSQRCQTTTNHTFWLTGRLLEDKCRPLTGISTEQKAYPKNNYLTTRLYRWSFYKAWEWSSLSRKC